MSILKSLSEFQTKFEGVEKKRQNPFTKSLYASLDDVVNTIKPILDDCGLLVMQPLRFIDGEQFLVTEIHHVESGESIESSVSLKLLMEKASAQGVGSAITYGRRYALCSILNIVETADDDGNAAEVQADHTSDQNQISKIYELIDVSGANESDVLAHCKKVFNVTDFKMLSYQQAQTIISMLNRKIDQNATKQ